MQKAKNILQKLQQTDSIPVARKYGPVAAVLVVLAAYFGSQIIVAFVYGLYISLTGRTSDVEAFTESVVGQFAFLTLVSLASLGILYVFMKRRKINLADIGLARKPKSDDVLYAVGFFVLYFILIALVLGLIREYVPFINTEQEQQVGFEVAKSNGGLLLIPVFISLVILPPLVEEIMVRGFMYTGLRTKLPQIISALVASFIFGIAHLQIGSGAPPLYVAAIDTFVLSLILILLRIRTGSLWAGIFVHAMKNGLAFAAIFLLQIS